MQETVKILGLNIANKRADDLLVDIDSSITTRKKRIYIPLNVDMVVRSRHDEEFKGILQQDVVLLADGMPLIWAAMFLGERIKEKISGSDLFPELCKLSADKRHKLFFLGSKPGVAIRARNVLLNKFSALNVVGIYSPTIGFENFDKENQKIIALINNAGADILFIGLGAPKQEKWIWKYKDSLNTPVVVCIGASFDFVSGAIIRAPRWMQKAGLEWFWRLMMEPKRLWKRYLINDPEFFWLVLKQKLGLLK